MDKLKAFTANALKQKQTIAFLLAVGGLVLVILVLVLLSSGGNSSKNVESTPIAKISTGTADVNNEAVWIQKSESVLEQLQESDKEKSKQIEELKSLVQSQQEKESQRQQEQANQLTQVLEKIQTLESHAPTPEIKLDGKHQSNQAGNSFDTSSLQDGNNSALELPTLGITKGTLNLETKQITHKNIDHYVPSGSHARAIILGGVDASASVSAQSDPKPVLLRLADGGTLPNQFKGQMKDCNVTAAAFGDISSERALMRLETLSCVNQKGEVFESQVSGYVTGEDGVTGVRGQIVYRERDLLNHSLLSGLLSGIGKGIENKFTPIPQAAGSTPPAIASEQILQAGMASGASNALEKYAEYHIHRAEQYQPTIQIGAGRKVDVVFTKGFEF